MIGDRISVRELAGWPLDNFEYRPVNCDPAKLLEAQRHIAQRSAYQQCDPVHITETAELKALLAGHATRPDLHQEMTGLDWSLGVVDLTLLLAFQRRLSFDPTLPVSLTPRPEDWPALTQIAFATSKIPVFDRVQQPGSFSLTSADPNLHLRTSRNHVSPMIVHAGSPFLEIASYRGRWFLRDGYHRAYTLLCAGVTKVPAVIVHAKSIKELGATQPWFFDEATLLSFTPPHVIDFLDDAVILQYNRPRLIKTIRVTIDETLAPAAPHGDQS